MTELQTVNQDEEHATPRRSTHLDWTGPDDPHDPHNWSLSRRVYSTVVICFIGFVTTMAASIYAPGHEQVMEDFDVSATIALLPLSFYNLGMALGPCISSPLSETYGRKFVYLVTLPLFDAFVIGTGFSRSIATLIVSRFFAGVFAAPGVSVASATITDFTHPAIRAIPLSAYYTIPFIGSVFGPLIGSIVTVHKGWRWTSWTILFFAAVIHPQVLCLKESFKPIILKRCLDNSGVQTTKLHKEKSTKVMQNFVRTTLIRPVHMLLCEPTVSFICLYTGFQFALLYTFVVASPWVFQHVYNFSMTDQGLSFLGLIIGCCVAPPCLIVIDRMVYQPKVNQIKADPDPDTRKVGVPPEDRLYGAMFGSLILPTGLFMFAWTSRGAIHWICPIVASGITILGSILVYVPCNFFMLDVYGSRYGASSAGASSLSRYLLSAAFPLFVIQMYESLGIGWATSVLGFIALVMTPIPWVFYSMGPRLRARTAYG